MPRYDSRNFEVDATGLDHDDDWFLHASICRGSLQQCGSRHTHGNIERVGHTKRFEIDQHTVANERIEGAVEHGFEAHQPGVSPSQAKYGRSKLKNRRHHNVRCSSEMWLDLWTHCDGSKQQNNSGQSGVYSGDSDVIKEQIYAHHNSRLGDWRPFAGMWSLFSDRLDRAGSEYPVTGHADESR